MYQTSQESPASISGRGSIAEKESLKSDFELADIGKRALKEIVYGDWEKGIANMKKEKADFIARHIWD